MKDFLSMWFGIVLLIFFGIASGFAGFVIGWFVYGWPTAVIGMIIIEAGVLSWLLR